MIQRSRSRCVVANAAPDSVLHKSQNKVHHSVHFVKCLMYTPVNLFYICLTAVLACHIVESQICSEINQIKNLNRSRYRFILVHVLKMIISQSLVSASGPIMDHQSFSGSDTTTRSWQNGVPLKV
ncbi:hypothetical protein CHARACLAT_021676 [Characodon lateralis]|uniref:Uncharacterized protein n=1 Tax=Characodon lateralis TaxID=208331 RepID=A0ABU7CSE4_9TELE|nr:hypothetical protein [Characodon lateralis]